MQTQPAQLPTVTIEARFVGDGSANGASPASIRITDLPALLKTLPSLSQVCLDNGLSYGVTNGAAMAEWEAASEDEDMDGVQLVVSATTFNFQGNSADGHCESAVLDIRELIEGIATCPAGFGLHFPANGKPRGFVEAERKAA